MREYKSAKVRSHTQKKDSCIYILSCKYELRSSLAQLKILKTIFLVNFKDIFPQSNQAKFYTIFMGG